jgi:uroporphyrinogen III methyltransferase/synthase
VPVDDTAPLNQGIERLGQYDWIVFTSVNGVKFFFEHLFQTGRDVRALNHLKTAAIGPVTAQKLLSYGLKSDIIPETYRAEAVVEAFQKEQMKGQRVLLPRASEARPVLPDELRNMGAEVDEIAAYRTEKVTDNGEQLVADLSAKRIDLVTFTSSSTVKNFKSLLPLETFEDLIDGLKVASIGPITTDTAVELGFEVDITAETYTIPGLCEAITRYFKG